MYPPLTNATYSPGVNEELWLLGIGFIEISAIAGAIEIIVGVLRTRAPGMTLGRVPVFAWAMLVFAVLIVFAFPAVILATTLLELERSFGWPFFNAGRGGDPLLWQHLFWFFGHPEVYIIFLPAAGMVSMIVPTMSRTPLVGYRLVVLALVGTGFLSFGLWVHHMFATGIPRLSASFFSAASMAVAIPSGIQVFAWIATLAKGRCGSPRRPSSSLGSCSSSCSGVSPGSWWRWCRSTGRRTTRTSSSRISITCCSAGWCSRCSPPSTTGCRIPAGTRCPSGSGAGCSASSSSVSTSRSSRCT